MTAAAPDPPTPWWRDARWWRAAALTYAVAIGGGLLARALGVPLPWMLGAFFACGALAATGVELRPLPYGRETAQMFVGLGVGLRFTPATLLTTLSLLPAMLAATVYVMAYTMVAALFFRPLAGTSRSTAFFATAAGGVADMAIVARQVGAEPAPVAMVHALRVSSTVAIVPVLVVSFGVPGEAAAAPGLAPQSALWLLAALAAAFASVFLVKRTPLPNPWLVGPMFVGVALGASGAIRQPVPSEAIVAAQLLLGAWLGARFTRETLLSLPRVAAAGILASLFMIGAGFAGAFVLAAVTPLSVTTGFLALAPAAVTEMVITAKAMNLNAEIVTAFHVIRIFLVCSTILGVYRIYCRLTGLDGPKHGAGT